MSLESILFLVVLCCALLLFGWQAKKLLDRIALGKPENRTDRPGTRIRTVLTVAFGQTKLLREPFAGALHFVIFWGFVILLTAVLESIGEGIAPGFSLAFLGPFYAPLVFLQDLIGILVVGSVVVSIFRRLLAPPKRLRVEGHSKWDAVLILGLILVVMLTMFGQNGARIALGWGEANSSRIVSQLVAGFFGGMENGTVSAAFHLCLWGHILAVLAFLNYLPGSKHLHVLTSVPNVYLLEPGTKRSPEPDQSG